MIRVCAALALGLLGGIAAGVRYEAAGVGSGDMNYTYHTFSWRGRRVEIHTEDRP